MRIKRSRKIILWELILLISFTVLLPEILFCQHQHQIQRVEKVQTEKKVKFWTCSMHPQIKLTKPGKCPICFMDLIPVYEETKKETSQLILSESTRKMAKIETSTVSYRNLTFELKLLGKIGYDETKIANISAWLSGRVDKLYINFIGAYVKKDEPLLQIYSPELRTAQEEYLIAFQLYQKALERNLKEEISSSQMVLESIRKKLELWGILPNQIAEIEKSGYAVDRMDIYAPISGVVIEREAFEGKYFQTGETLFKIADLKNLWVKLDVYEKNLAHIHTGQKINFVIESFPGEVFSGKVIFIDPFLNETTRTAKIRIEIPNPEMKLKPGMFGHAILKIEMGKKLSIPATAPLLTGKRAIVYVEEKRNVFEGREVILGPRAGDFYPVISGLRAGEKVVTKGNFMIDASLQIQAKPSMMNPR